jgi:hypothetical protein
MNGEHEERVLGRVLAVEESRDVHGGQPGDPITEIGETAPISDQTTRRRDSGTVQDSGTSLDSGTIADCVLSGPLKEDCIGTAGGATNEN